MARCTTRLGSLSALAALATLGASIRPGSCHHQVENAKVKSVATLLDIYFTSVGRNATPLLNLPPDRRGLIAPPDSAALAGLGDGLRATFASDLTTDRVRLRILATRAEPRLDRPGLFLLASPRD